MENSKKRFFVRTTDIEEKVKEVFGDVTFINANIADEIGFITPVLTEKTYKEKAANLNNVLSMIRVEE